MEDIFARDIQPILENIFRRLNLQDLASCLMVSEEWENVISSLKFPDNRLETINNSKSANSLWRGLTDANSRTVRIPEKDRKICLEGGFIEEDCYLFWYSDEISNEESVLVYDLELQWVADIKLPTIGKNYDKAQRCATTNKDFYVIFYNASLIIYNKESLTWEKKYNYGSRYFLFQKQAGQIFMHQFMEICTKLFVFKIDSVKGTPEWKHVVPFEVERSIDLVRNFVTLKVCPNAKRGVVIGES